MIGSAVQGAVLQVLGHTTQGGGWYKVQGATINGWISANSAFSRPGRFASYESTSFSVLYPAGWTSSGSPRSGVTFESPSKAEKIVIATAPSLSKLPSVKQGAGVSQNGSQQVVACGVTGYLFSYATLASRPLPRRSRPLARPSSRSWHKGHPDLHRGAQNSARVRQFSVLPLPRMCGCASDHHDDLSEQGPPAPHPEHYLA